MSRIDTSRIDELRIGTPQLHTVRLDETLGTKEQFESIKPYIRFESIEVGLFSNRSPYHYFESIHIRLLRINQNIAISNRSPRPFSFAAIDSKLRIQNQLKLLILESMRSDERRHFDRCDSNDLTPQSH